MLLTGSTGFVGSQVARVLLDAGCEVSALIRPGSSTARIAHLMPSLTVVSGDLTALSGTDLLDRVEPDLCLHLAWYAEPRRYLHAVPENLASLRASLDLVEALARSDCRRLVVTGTCAEYGPSPSGEALEEESPLQPATPYARAKGALWLAAQDTAAQAGMGLAWARLFFLYGPWEQPERVVPAAVAACLAGRHFPATAGAQVRDYLHVADAASALWAIAGSALVGPVNVGSGEATTLRQVLEEVEAATSAPGVVGFGERPYGPSEWMHMVGSNRRLRTTGWRPAFDLRNGIADTVAWWRSHTLAAR